MPGDIALSVKDESTQELVEDSISMEPLPVETAVAHGLEDGEELDRLTSTLDSHRINL